MDNPVAVAIFGMFPQMFLNFYAPLGLVGAKTPFKKLIVPAVMLTVMVSITRSIPDLFGWHIPIFLLLYLGIARALQITTFITALASGALSFILVALGDVVLALPVLNLFGLRFDDVISNWVIHVGFLWLESIILLVAAMLVSFRSFVLIPVARGRIPSRSPGDME